MKFELLIFGITGFFIANIYHDGKYVQLVKTWKKYYQMAGIAFIGLSAYLFIRKYPGHSRSLFEHANGMIKYMPIDKEASDLLTPLLDMTKQTFSYNGSSSSQLTPQQRKVLSSGMTAGQGQGQVQGYGTSTQGQGQMQGQGTSTQKATKRCVSETKKKFVAAEQGWCCGSCKNKLPAWFEVDHKIRLEQGGSNHVDNLVALCRDCHGKKTAFENL
jgi:hypothetical protein